MCVAERLSEYCETILNIEGLCKSGLRCCVAKEIFNGKYPAELVIPGKDPLPPPVTTTSTITGRCSQHLLIRVSYYLTSYSVKASRGIEKFCNVLDKSLT